MADKKDSDDCVKYPILEGIGNYAVWSKRLLVYLALKGITGLKEGRFISPSTTEPTKLAEWNKLDTTAKECLVRFLSDNVFMPINKSQSTQLIWNNLQATYGGKDWVT
ncbi:hypothetical protein BCR33DRAFT_720342 [Rhizoclosmatium globosum]|uniref:DUF4219 domain-containing protein n=1 Tax=Rhizoclosmatium globosum TaxID=329046 RepID=A0A1Y2BWQ4_9FUNG|nr:hypothetical protein BCR33DRAFT_720342 [Rhizoclosmatium globosum]|eukprot:ORY39094.1 hypothetical protein BCR33DRAFT_720342 [Rhizoclosmatium globosum]